MRDSFYSYHPIVNFTYFLLVLVFSMMSRHPVCLGISIVTSIGYSVYLTGKKAVFFNLKYMLPLMILGVHKCITDKNSVLLSVSTALCILFNWYAAGIACLFTIIWFFYEATLFVCGQDRPCSKHTISSLLSLFFRFGIAMVTAVLLSCVTFLPEEEPHEL